MYGLDKKSKSEIRIILYILGGGVPSSPFVFSLPLAIWLTGSDNSTPDVHLRIT